MGNSNNTETVENVEYIYPTTRDTAKRLAEEEFHKEMHKRLTEKKQTEVKQKCGELCKQLNSYYVGQTLSLSKKFDLTGLRTLNIALIGPTGSGKSSFIGLAEYIFNGEISVELQDSGKEGSIHLETYFSGKGFQIYDTRGFGYINEGIHKELKMILSGQIKLGMVIQRPFDEHSSAGTQYKEDYEAPLCDRMHVVVIIVNVQDPRISMFIETMIDLRKHCTGKGLETVCVFVSEDPENRRLNSEVRRLANTMDAAADRVFYIVNHIAVNSIHKMKTDYESQWNILQVIDTAILAGERYIKHRKQLELNEFLKSSKTGAQINKSVAQIFEEISKEHGVPAHCLQAFSAYLESERIRNVKTLKDVWDDLDPFRMPSITIQRWIKEKLGSSN